MNLRVCLPGFRQGLFPLDQDLSTHHQDFFLLPLRSQLVQVPELLRFEKPVI